MWQWAGNDPLRSISLRMQQEGDLPLLSPSGCGWVLPDHSHANSGFSFQNHSRFCEGLGPRHEVQPYFMIPTEQDEMTAIVQVFPFFCCRLHSELKGYVSALLNEMSAIWRGKNAAVGGTNVKYHYYLAFFIKS